MAESSCREYPGLARPDLEAGLAALEAVRAGLAGDRGKTTVYGFSALSLLEMIRTAP